MHDKTQLYTKDEYILSWMNLSISANSRFLFIVLMIGIRKIREIPKRQNKFIETYEIIQLFFFKINYSSFVELLHT